MEIDCTISQVGPGEQYEDAIRTAAVSIAFALVNRYIDQSGPVPDTDRGRAALYGEFQRALLFLRRSGGVFRDLPEASLAWHLAPDLVVNWPGGAATLTRGRR